MRQRTYRISSAMQLGRVDYLGVAFADEGGTAAGRHQYTDNRYEPEPRSFALMLEYGLEPKCIATEFLKLLMTLLIPLAMSHTQYI